MNPLPPTPDSHPSPAARPRGARGDFFARCEIAQAWVAGPWLGLLLLGLFLLSQAFTQGCRRSGEFVVVYAAQDRVFAEPIFAEFTRESGIEVRAVYDNEATKTTGLANRLLTEADHPQADVWWSNEEMRTWQLEQEGALVRPIHDFGRRERVLVVHTHTLATRSWEGFSLKQLGEPEFRGRVALAFPLFGSTAAHFLTLRQRWGEPAWQAWCRALMANRPWLMDGNSVVVRAVANGQAAVGLTDSDDVRFAQREGLPVVALPLPSHEGLRLANTVALVNRAPHREAGERLARFLAGPGVQVRLVAAGAIDADRPTTSPTPEPSGSGSEANWTEVLAELDPALSWMQSVFVRVP